MKKVDVTIDLVGKKNELHYETGTLYTTSPKYFMKYYLCNEVEECGLYLRGTAISESGDVELRNTNVEEDTQNKDLFIPTATAGEAVDKYKTALKVIDVEEVDRIHTAKEIWEWIKENAFKFEKSNFALFAIIWLFSDKSIGYTGWLATLCLLCNLNVYEVVRMVRATFIKDYNKELLETEVWQMGLSDLIYNPVKREDLQLYMKVKDGNFKFK